MGYQTTFFTDTGQKKSWKNVFFLVRVEKLSDLSSELEKLNIFWPELKKFTFLVRVENLLAFRVRVGKMIVF